jgi:hypothetical protein
MNLSEFTARALHTNLRRSVLAALSLAFFAGTPAYAVPPTFATNTCPVKLNGTNVGTALTAGGSSLRNTVAYDSAAKLYHFWGFTADDASFPSSASALTAVTHATSTDGLHFVSDGQLSYGVGSANYTTFGATIDPPLDFFRAVYDTDTDTWKLFNWTENDQVSDPSFGQYNYNTSVNDLGTSPSNTSVVHQGPLNTPVAGNHAGSFGLVDGQLYLRVDGGAADGGNGQFSYTDGIPASTGAMASEANLFNGTPYCWGLDPACSTTDPRTPAYVHNVGRTLRQFDGTLGTYYAFRHWDGTRIDKQIWYVESSDNGATWSDPSGVFADGSAITIDRQPLDADTDTANFSSVDVTEVGDAYHAYFSTQNATGDYVFVSSVSMAADTIFADGFEGCGD